MAQPGAVACAEEIAAQQIASRLSAFLLIFNVRYSAGAIDFSRFPVGDDSERPNIYIDAGRKYFVTDPDFANLVPALRRRAAKVVIRAAADPGCKVNNLGSNTAACLPSDESTYAKLIFLSVSSSDRKPNSFVDEILLPGTQWSEGGDAYKILFISHGEVRATADVVGDGNAVSVGVDDARDASDVVAVIDGALAVGPFLDGGSGYYIDMSNPPTTLFNTIDVFRY